MNEMSVNTGSCPVCESNDINSVYGYVDTRADGTDYQSIMIWCVDCDHTFYETFDVCDILDEALFVKKWRG